MVGGEVEREIFLILRALDDKTTQSLALIFVPIITNNIAYLKSIAHQWKGVKAKLHLDDVSLSPIQLALHCNNAAAIAVLASVCEAHSLDQLLSEAVKHSKTDCALALIATGADVNQKFGDLTPLMKAAYEGNLAVMKTIIAQDGAELNAQRNNGATALYLAIDLEKTECALALIAAGADVNHGYGDKTPLMQAAQDGNHAVVAAIINSGRVNLDQRSNRSTGEEAYALARQGEHKDCAILIARALLVHTSRYARHWPRNIQDIYIEWYGQYDGPIKSVDVAEKAIKTIAAIEDEATKCFLANQILHCKGSPLYVIAHSKSKNGLINSAIARLFKQQQSGPLSEVRSIFDESRKRLEASGNYLPYSIPCDSQVGDDGDESKHDDSVVEAAVIAQPLRQ